VRPSALPWLPASVRGDPDHVLALGIGLAFPYVLLSWQPAWLKFVPKPGLWMERFKIAMGFPMLAAAVWLFSLVSLHYGERSWWLAIFLVMVAVAAWIYGEFMQRHRTRPILAAVAIVVVLATAYGFALESNLQWRHPLTQTQSPRRRSVILMASPGRRGLRQRSLRRAPKAAHTG